jgi:hypothetical protein
MKIFDTNTELALANLTAGQYVETYGDTIVGDTGSYRYYVESSGYTPAPEDVIVTLANGNQARRLFKIGEAPRATEVINDSGESGDAVSDALDNLRTDITANTASIAGISTINGFPDWDVPLNPLICDTANNSNITASVQVNGNVIHEHTGGGGTVQGRSYENFTANQQITIGGSETGIYFKGPQADGAVTLPVSNLTRFCIGLTDVATPSAGGEYVYGVLFYKDSIGVWNYQLGLFDSSTGFIIAGSTWVIGTVPIADIEGASRKLFAVTIEVTDSTNLTLRLKSGATVGSVTTVDSIVHDHSDVGIANNIDPTALQTRFLNIINSSALTINVEEIFALDFSMSGVNTLADETIDYTDVTADQPYQVRQTNFNSGQLSIVHTVLTADSVIYRDGGTTLKELVEKTTTDALDSRVTVTETDISNIPTVYYNYKGGLELSNSSGDALNDLDITAGIAADSTNTTMIELSAGVTTQIDADIGTGNGGWPNTAGGPTLTANTWYPVFIVSEADGSNPKVGFDGQTNATYLLQACTEQFAGTYTLYRRIGWILTDGSSDIVAFNQYGDEFYWDVIVNDRNYTASNATRTAVPITAPPNLQAYITVYTQGATVYGLITSLDQTDTAPSSTLYNILADGGTSQTRAKTELSVQTDASSNIYERSDSTSMSITILTMGWRDLFN